ncbi:glycoside hydrolase family 43 protein [Flavobacteriaceae bacterium]|nr:glycoside hydrolase family 43 protein [Flavobacteriaceae bacterium]MDC3329911.1 glycoside hydrolase family 43 protein [Flavobacteriaceae bacterium]
MKNSVVLLLTLVLLGCNQQEADVYLFSFFKGNGEDGLHLAASRDGFSWEALNNNQSFLKPQVGKDKLMRDPCIIKGGDGKFHMVWTVSWNEKGIGYANSTDLIHWSEQKYLPVMEHETEARNCWAPELFYDTDSKTYLLFWATTLPGRFPETDALGDDGYNHRMYATTTKDFIDFSETKLFYEPGFNVIDATILKTKDAYRMFIKDEALLPEPKKNIRIATSDKLQTQWSPPSEPITQNWVEGPTVMQFNDHWIVYFDRYTEGKMGAVRSSDLKTWTDISDQIQFPEGTRHGTIFNVKESLYNKIKSQNKK